jgi:hypothetical protein
MTSRDKSDFERDLTSTLERCAPKPRGELLGRAMVGVARTPQRRRSLAVLSETWLALDRSRVAAVAGVAGVALVAGVAIGTSGMLRTGDSRSPTPQPSSASSAPFADWNRHDLPDPAPDVYGGATPNDVVAFGGGYVAVGTVNVSCCADGDPSENRGVVWTSTDGSGWDVRDDLPALEHAMLSRILTDGSRLLALGSYAEPQAGKPGASQPALWVSLDGLAWDRVPGQVPSVVVASTDGFIGAFVGHMRCLCSHDEYTFFMTSTNGVAWSESSPRRGGPAGLILDMAVAPDGRAVAVGTAYTARAGQAPGFDAIASTSPDGVTWETVTVAKHARLSSIAHYDGRFFAIATGDELTEEGPKGDAIWSSADGVSWTPAAIPLTSLTRDETLRRIFAVVGVLLAVGDDRDGNPFAWVSVDDGMRWDRVPAQSAFAGTDVQIASVIPSGNGLLAVGRRWDPRTNHPLPQVWLAQP